MIELIWFRDPPPRGRQYNWKPSFRLRVNQFSSTLSDENTLVRKAELRISEQRDRAEKVVEVNNPHFSRERFGHLRFCEYLATSGADGVAGRDDYPRLNPGELSQDANRFG